MVYMDVYSVYMCAYGVCDLYVCLFQCVSTGMCFSARVEVCRQPSWTVLAFHPVWDRASLPVATAYTTEQLARELPDIFLSLPLFSG